MFGMRIFIVVFAIMCAGLVSHAQQTNANDKLLADASKLVSVESEGSLVSEKLRQDTAQWIQEKDYAKLDQLADNLRRSKEQIAVGTWKLLILYHVLSFEETRTEKVPDKVWTEREAFLKSWVAKMPNSISARIALARYYCNYAWNARGSGFANTVTPEGWRLFEERIKLSKKTLNEAKALPAKCPVWWDSMQGVALGEGWNLSAYNQLFDQAIAFEPAYTSYYFKKAVYLLPRWFGKEGDWQKFAAQSADRVGGEAGDILYARIGWKIHEARWYKGFMRDAGYSWPRMKTGLEAIVKQNPQSITAASELAYFAYEVKDRACGKPLFERIGHRVDKGVWHSDKDRFRNARIWALWQ